jgi:hypothetical protein
MKKTYKNPTTTLVKIQHRSIIMNSTIQMSSKSAKQEYGMSARQSGNSGWDDDYEDD